MSGVFNPGMRRTSMLSAAGLQVSRSGPHEPPAASRRQNLFDALDGGATSSIPQRDEVYDEFNDGNSTCLLYTSPSPRDATLSRMPSSA